VIYADRSKAAITNPRPLETAPDLAEAVRDHGVDGMNSSLGAAILAGALPLVACARFGKSDGETAAQPLSIRVYDLANAPDAVLRSAMNEASRLFRPAGVRILWDQPLAEPPEDRGTDQSAAASSRPDNRRYLVVRLIRQTPATAFPGALGFALPFARTGAHVLIFYDRMEPLSLRMNIGTYVMLGYTMAHEIAHALLRSSEHSIGGLMTARWTPATWRLASAGLLAFQPEETERIRAGLRRFQPTDPIPPPEPLLASNGRE